MKVIRPISAVVLALLVLVSSTSFVVGLHFCMGEVKSVALFTKAESCAKQKDVPPCHRKHKASCCQDETIVHTGESFKASIAKVAMSVPVAVIVEHSFVLISEVIPDAPLARIQYRNYDPPLRSSDITVEHQLFLI
jgi:hypothetical protein